MLATVVCVKEGLARCEWPCERERCLVGCVATPCCEVVVMEASDGIYSTYLGPLFSLRLRLISHGTAAPVSCLAGLVSEPE